MTHKTPFEHFISPAENGLNRAPFWGYIALIIAIITIVLVICHFLLKALAGIIFVANQPAILSLFLLLTFCGTYPALWLVMRLQKRNFLSLLGPQGFGKPFWRGFFLSVTVASFFLGIAALLAFSGKTSLPAPLPNLDFKNWLGLLPFIIVVIFLQTGAEEILFRGYILQVSAARSRNPISWAITPSLVFALLHYTPEGGAFVAALIIAYAAIFALLAIDLTRISGTLGPAWGIHFINNFFALSIIALDFQLGDHTALYITSYTLHDILPFTHAFGYALITLILVWLTLRRLVRPRSQRPALGR